MSDPQNPTYAYVGAFVDELQRSGLRHVVICPGSRSTPLAMAFAEISAVRVTLAAIPAIRTWMHVDERSAAFFALGMAKSLNEPVALLCTSGTAAANFLPAIVEAHLTHVPLLILTADRPPELRDCGAPQAIDQNRLYGTHVKWYAETALPEATNESLRYIRTIACRAVAQARALPAGPVHLNMPFREPLTPAPIAGQPLPPESERDSLAWQGRPTEQPYIGVNEVGLLPPRIGMITQLVERIKTAPRGLIIAGPQTDPELAEPLLQLAHQTGYPILADPLSQVRGRGNEEDLLITSYDAFLRSERFCSHYEPQLILRFGAMPVSKPVLLYLKRYPACPQVVIDPHHGWEEPTQLAAWVFYSDAITFCYHLTEALRNKFDPFVELEHEDALYQDVPPRMTDWTEAWQETDRVTRQALSTAINNLPDLFEGRIFTELAELLPIGSLLYTGNSMPVRDMDTFFWPRMPAKPDDMDLFDWREIARIRCLGNRGASGIDGMISSALGASAARGPDEPAVLVIGDLSFYHDLNGLLAARLHGLDLTIVLVNNDGGGIFSFLPQAAYPEHFEQLFGTPTGLDLRPVVEMYGGSFQRVEDWDEFRQAVKAGLTGGGLRVIEVQTERERNVKAHRILWRSVEMALESAGLLGGSEE